VKYWDFSLSHICNHELLSTESPSVSGFCSHSSWCSWYLPCLISVSYYCRPSCGWLLYFGCFFCVRSTSLLGLERGGLIRHPISRWDFQWFWVNFITTSLWPKPGIMVRIREIIPKWPQDSGWWIIISFTQMIFMVFLLSYHRQDTSGERLGVDSWIFQRVVEKLDNKSLAHRTQMSCENMA